VYHGVYVAVGCGISVVVDGGIVVVVNCVVDGVVYVDVDGGVYDGVHGVADVVDVFVYYVDNDVVCGGRILCGLWRCILCCRWCCR